MEELYSDTRVQAQHPTFIISSNPHRIRLWMAKLRLRASDSQGQATELAGVVKSSNSEAWWYWILASPCAGDPTFDLASVKGLHAWTGPGAGPPGQLDGGWTRIHTDLVFCPLPAARSSSHAALAGWGGSRHALFLTQSPRCTPWAPSPLGPPCWPLCSTVNLVTWSSQLVQTVQCGEEALGAEAFISMWLAKRQAPAGHPGRRPAPWL